MRTNHERKQLSAITQERTASRRSVKRGVKVGGRRDRIEGEREWGGVPPPFKEFIN